MGYPCMARLPEQLERGDIRGDTHSLPYPKHRLSHSHTHTHTHTLSHTHTHFVITMSKTHTHTHTHTHIHTQTPDQCIIFRQMQQITKP